MATTISKSLQINRLGRRKMSALASKAKRLGMTPAQYVKQLVEEDLAVSREAQTVTFAQLMGPGRDVDEAELDSLVEAARTRHYQEITKRKKK